MRDGQEEYSNIQGYLDSQFYTEDGEFKPVVASHGNISGEFAYVRNAYMEAERDYFTALLSNKSIRDQFTSYAYSDNYNPDFLFEAAMKLQENLENDNLHTKEELDAMKDMTPEERDRFHIDKLSETEGLIALLLGAIRDKALVLDYLIPYRTEIPSELEPEPDMVRGMRH